MLPYVIPRDCSAPRESCLSCTVLFALTVDVLRLITLGG
jgi:hypothetical protein